MLLCEYCPYHCTCCCCYCCCCCCTCCCCCGGCYHYCCYYCFYRYCRRRRRHRHSGCTNSASTACYLLLSTPCLPLTTYSHYPHGDGCRLSQMSPGRLAPGEPATWPVNKAHAAMLTQSLWPMIQCFLHCNQHCVSEHNHHRVSNFTALHVCPIDDTALPVCRYGIRITCVRYVTRSTRISHKLISA